MPLLNVALVPAPDQVVVRLTGDADLSTVPQLTDALVQAAGLGTRQLVVDVAAARFWDSAALRALASFSLELTTAGRACRVVGAGRDTRRLVRVTGLSDCLELDGPVFERAVPRHPETRSTERPPVPPRRSSRVPVGALNRWR